MKPNSGIYDLLAKLKAHNEMEHLTGTKSPAPMGAPPMSGMMPPHQPMAPMAPMAPMGPPPVMGGMPSMPSMPGGMMKANHPFGRR